MVRQKLCVLLMQALRTVIGKSLVPFLHHLSPAEVSLHGYYHSLHGSLCHQWVNVTSVVKEYFERAERYIQVYLMITF